MSLQKVHTISADVSSELVKNDIEQELSGLPPVDVLVNSAGVTHSGAFQDTSSEAFEVGSEVWLHLSPLSYTFFRFSFPLPLPCVCVQKLHE